jgi:hypothetical protein
MTSSLTPSLRRRFASRLLPVIAVICAGCSRSGPTLYPVRGKILFEGQPARGATLVFHPLGNSDPNAVKPRAFVDRDGTFEVFTYAAGDGAPAGEYAVTVAGRMWPGAGSRPPQAAAKQGRRFPAGAAVWRGQGLRRPGAGKGGPGMPAQAAWRRRPGAPPSGTWARPAQLPARYQRPETSDLRISVQPGDNDLEPLALKKHP